MQSLNIDKLAPAEWPELPIPAEQVKSGTPDSKWRVLYETEDGRFICGFWRCNVCAFSWNYEVHEVLTVLSGRATVAIYAGPTVELEPGVVAHFLPGQKAVWTIHETITKSFSISKW